jgi:hypothetical protein
MNSIFVVNLSNYYVSDMDNVGEKERSDDDVSEADIEEVEDEMSGMCFFYTVPSLIHKI